MAGKNSGLQIPGQMSGPAYQGMRTRQGGMAQVPVANPPNGMMVGAGVSPASQQQQLGQAAALRQQQPQMRSMPNG